MQILNVNTVQPRLQRMHEAQRRRALRETYPDTGEPVDVVADLSPIAEIKTFTESMTQHRDRIRQSDPAVRKWEGEILDQVEQWARNLEVPSAPTSEDACALAENIAKKLSEMPSGKTARIGKLNYDSWDEVSDKLDEGLGGSEIDTTPTTLGRVTPQAAFRLLVRGYVNTFIQSMFLESRTDYEEIERLCSIRDCIHTTAATMRVFP